MRHIPVAFPARFAFTQGLSHLVIGLSYPGHAGNKVLMATDAIVHDDLCTGILGCGDLWLYKGQESCRVFKSVHALEGILAGHIFMRHVAFVAGGHVLMRGMVPCGVIRLHDMAVYAGRRIVSKVSMKTKHVHEKESRPDESAGEG